MAVVEQDHTAVAAYSAACTAADGGTSELELEYKRKTDGSWHPCQVSLSSGGALSVKYQGQDLEDILFNLQDAFAHLRIRSTPLQEDDCSYLEEGKSVLAAYERNFERLFFDAEVQKAIRVRHSKRNSCRCSFMIKWHSKNEASVVPSSSLLKLASESIESHPVISAFFGTIKESCLASSVSSPPIPFDDSECEVDLHGLLKQIGGICNFSNESKIEPPRDTLDGVKHGITEGRTKVVTSEHMSDFSTEISYRKNGLRKSSRNQCKEDKINSAPPSIENSIEKHSPLSPLAARAALASLVSKIPHQNVSLYPNEGKCISMFGYTTHMHDFGDTDTQKANSSGYSSAKPENNPESFESVEASGEKLHAPMSFGALFMEVCNAEDQYIKSGVSLSSTVTKDTTQPARGSKLKRSATKQSDGVTRMPSIDRLCVRVTRSGACNRKEDLIIKTKEKLHSEQVRETRSMSSIVTQGAASGLSQSNRTPDKLNFSSLEKTTRLTRSAARQSIGNSDDEFKKAAEAELGHAHTQNSEPSSCGYVVSMKKRSAEVDLELSECGKKEKGLIAAGSSQKTAAKGSQETEIDRSQNKSSSSKKQPLRFSPRLRSNV